MLKMLNCSEHKTIKIRNVFKEMVIYFSENQTKFSDGAGRLTGGRILTGGEAYPAPHLRGPRRPPHSTPITLRLQRGLADFWRLLISRL